MKRSMLQREGQGVEDIKFGSKLHITRCNTTLFYTNIRHSRREINIHIRSVFIYTARY